MKDINKPSNHKDFELSSSSASELDAGGLVPERVNFALGLGGLNLGPTPEGNINSAAPPGHGAGVAVPSASRHEETTCSWPPTRPSFTESCV
jgi:hypothetical protein